ncbi:MAG: hypothetical protein ACXVB4_01505 [Pseudobdellovibrionaceae bacterium]
MGANYRNSTAITKLAKILHDEGCELILKFGPHEAVLSGELEKEFLFNLRKHDVSDMPEFLTAIKKNFVSVVSEKSSTKIKTKK